MSLNEVCRACLRTSRTICPLMEAIVPKLDSQSDSVVELWNMFGKLLISYEDKLPNKICRECLDEIQRSYSFILKCKRSEDILTKIRNVKICLKNLKMGSILRGHDSLKDIKFENNLYPNISQIKTENCELNESENEYAEEDRDTGHVGVTILAKVDSPGDTRLQETLIMQQEDDRFEIELLDELESESDVTSDKLSATQDIKQESEVDINVETDELDEIESENKSSIEILKCLACDYESSMIESLKEHTIEKHMDGQMCKLCSKEYQCSAPEHCTTHLHMSSTEAVLKSTNSKLYKCKICSKIFESKYNLERHSIIHPGERSLKCKICMKTFPHKSDLTTHLRCHPVERPFKCEFCPITFQQKNNLTTHLRWHTGDGHTGERPFKCESCPQSFQQKRYLTEHSRCHTGERPFKCEICSKLFSKETNLTGHLRCHTGERPFKCEFCAETFREKRSLAVHLQCHTGERPFKCEICFKSFQRKDVLTRHSRCHTGERPFKCEICSKTFAEKSYLALHFRCHTGERPYKCEICSNTFRHTSHLAAHLRSHTGERPYKCEICPQTYRQKSHLTAHLRYHAGERPFKCEICSKSFQQKNHLTRHSRYHTGERPFKCESCPKTFGDKSILTRHLGKHTTQDDGNNRFNPENTEREQFKAAIHANLDSQVDQLSQLKAIVQQQGDNEGVSFENDAKIPASQEINEFTEF